MKPKGSLHERGKDWPGPQCPTLEPWPPQGLQLLAGSALPLPTWQFSCALAAGSCLMRLFPSSQERLVDSMNPLSTRQRPTPLFCHT